MVVGVVLVGGSGGGGTLVANKPDTAGLGDYFATRGIFTSIFTVLLACEPPKKISCI